MLECWIDFYRGESRINVFAEYTNTASNDGKDSYEREFNLNWDVATGQISGAWNGNLIGGE